jgi:hypothetical protein
MLKAAGNRTHYFATGELQLLSLALAITFRHRLEKPVSDRKDGE